MKPTHGSLDTLHLQELYGDWPTVAPFTGDIPNRFVSWANRKRARPEDGIHFFTDDYRFEPVWKRPDEARRWIEGRVITGPDFSVWNEMPYAMKTWQRYRGAWLSKALEERGARVIPTVTWGHNWFDDVKHGGIVAVSAYGARRAGEKFETGYRWMTAVIRPSRVLVIGGKMPDWLAADPLVVYRKAGSIADGR